MPAYWFPFVCQTEQASPINPFLGSIHVLLRVLLPQTYGEEEGDYVYKDYVVQA